MDLETIFRHYIDKTYCTHEFRIVTLNKYMDGIITFTVRFRRKSIIMKPPKYMQFKLIYFGTCLVGFETHEDHIEEIEKIANQKY